MFNFIKKGVSVSDRDREKTDRDKERRKKDKKSRKDVKQSISGNMSSEELLRLDEVSTIWVGNRQLFNLSDIRCAQSLFIFH